MAGAASGHCSWSDVCVCTWLGGNLVRTVRSVWGLEDQREVWILP